jgi:hypothetical protein
VLSMISLHQDSAAVPLTDRFGFGGAAGSMTS